LFVFLFVFISCSNKATYAEARKNENKVVRNEDILTTEDERDKRTRKTRKVKKPFDNSVSPANKKKQKKTDMYSSSDENEDASPLPPPPPTQLVQSIYYFFRNIWCFLTFSIVILANPQGMHDRPPASGLLRLQAILVQRKKMKLTTVLKKSLIF
jgi:hypothetical protein